MNEPDETVELAVASVDDAAAMLAVIHQAFAARPAVKPPAAALSDTVDDIVASLERAPGVLACIDGEIVGCLLLSLDGRVAGLHRVSVRPDVRQHGVAAVLVRGAAELAVDLGATRLELLCRKEFPETRQWWEHHGFEVCATQELGWTMGRDLPARIEVPTGGSMQALGERLAGLLQAGDVVVASGDLGAGKTTLAQGIGRGMDVDGPVISPTFVISRVHHSRSGGPALVHVDAYRLGSEAELFDLDLDDTLESSVTLVEWGAGLAEGLGSSVLDIDIRRSADPDDETRVVYLTGFGERWKGVDLHALEEDA